MSKIEQNIKDNESLFGSAIKQFDNIFENAKKDYWNFYLVLEILDENPHQFFAILDKLLWKIEDKNLEKVEQKNGKILMKYTEFEDGANHSTRNVLIVPDEYIILRKIINKYIYKLKIDIRMFEALEL